MEKEVAISILEDIENSLQKENWKDESLKTIAIYRKGLEIAINPKIEKLIEKHRKYIEKYGENNQKSIKIGKKIDEEVQKNYNS